MWNIEFVRVDFNISTPLTVIPMASELSDFMALFFLIRLVFYLIVMRK